MSEPVSVTAINSNTPVNTRPTTPERQSTLSPVTESQLFRESVGSDVGLTRKDGVELTSRLGDAADTIGKAVQQGDIEGLKKGLETVIAMLQELLQKLGKGSEEPAGETPDKGGPSTSGAPGADAPGPSEESGADTGVMKLLKALIALMKKMGFSDKAIQSMLGDALKGTGLESQLPQLIAEAGAGAGMGAGEVDPGSQQRNLMPTTAMPV
jgi:hypothetical protein